MGSRSDWETMRHAAETLDELGVPYETEVVSAHRTPDKLFAYAEAAESRGLQVIIAGAGGAAHLPGMTSSKTLLPVLGVPVESKTLQGLDSLLSIAQMPAGRARRDARDRAGRRGQRGAARGRDRRARGREACESGSPRTARARPSPCSRRPIRRRDARSSAASGAASSGACWRSPGHRSACASASSTRRRTRARATSASSLVGRVRRPRAPRPPRRRRRRGHLRVRERPGRGGATRRGGPRRACARAGPGPPRREGALPAASASRPRASARWRRPACPRS